ncbi:MAG: hypothetical protein HY304_01165, partial [candidate division Zixibacteria bacterium]|nr:hypothetical protein [candidate division Zixibacteria bacterium]
MTPKYNPLRLSPFIVALICYLLPCASPAPAAHHDPQLDPYIEFLGHQTTSAKEYVLGMFKDHDLVILCERDHRDTTQYNLFLSVIRDEWFIKNVGIVFTEVGTSSLNPELNAFLHSDNLPADSVDRAILNFHRNCDWFLMWEKTNFSLFLHGVYAINRTLPPKDKLTLYPSDMPLDWSQMDSAKYAAFQGTLGGRDSVMAAEIIDQFEKLDKPDAGH